MDIKIFVFIHQRKWKEYIIVLKKNRKKQQKDNRLPIVAVLCFISILVMIVTLCSSKEKKGAFVPPAFESMAQVGTPTVPEDLGWSELDAQAFQVSVCGKFVVNDNTADVWLTNPKENTVWLKLRVLDTEGTILGETGLLKPGEYVRCITLQTVPKEGTPIVLKLMAYQPDTYYSEGTVTLNTIVSEGGNE